LVVGPSVSFLLSISPGEHQHACPSYYKGIRNLLRIIDMFYGEINAKAVLGHLVLIRLSDGSAKFVGCGGLDLTANPNS
jgi:hypothetical protein